MECLLNPGEFKDAVCHHSNGHENTEVYLNFLEYNALKEKLGYDRCDFYVWKNYHPNVRRAKISVAKSVAIKRNVV